jgi:hypothetical protein
MSQKERTVQFLYAKTNNYGLSKDVAVLTALFHKAGRFRCSSVDPHEPPKSCDIQVHLEVPIYANVPWATVNVLLVNPEYYAPEAFDPYLSAFDAVVVRDRAAVDLFAARGMTVIHLPGIGVHSATQNSRQIGTGAPGSNIKRSKMELEGWLWVIGGSARKMAAARAFLPLVEAHDQPIKIITNREDYAVELRRLAPANVTVERDFLELEELQFLQKNYKGHIVVSEAEGFSHAAAEARAVGALVLATRLPVLMEHSHEESTVYMGDNATSKGHYYAVDCSTFSRDQWIVAQGRLESFKPSLAIEEESRKAATDRWIQKIGELRGLCDQLLETTGVRHLPPVLEVADLPPISIVTLTYNRRKFIDLAFHNLMWSDYPLDKIEWIVVEDSDHDQSASDKISAFASRCEERPNNTFKVVYVPLARRTPVGEKRNIGCERATNDIILFMDDDDHYPTTSFRRRVSWLIKGRSAVEQRAVGCTMMAMYDLIKGTSAVNVPPWGLPLSQRLSEASLAFRKSFWEERRFPAINVAEGEDWIKGREAEFLEIPPQQILVAMNHGGNIGGRKMPSDAKPSCFWGFSPEMLKFLHGLAGMVVEFNDVAAGSGGAKKKRV